MIAEILGKKLGMTQVYDAQNVLVPVTVVEAGPCAVVQVKTAESDGYNAVQIGFATKKDKNSSAGELGHAKKAGLDRGSPRARRGSPVRPPTLKVGDIISAAAFTEGQLVDVNRRDQGQGLPRRGQALARRRRSRRPTARCSIAESVLDRHAPDPRPRRGKTRSCPDTWAARSARCRTCASSR
jgi:hypothetical protein